MVGRDDVISMSDNRQLVSAGEVVQASQLATMVGVGLAVLERPNVVESPVVLEPEDSEVGDGGTTRRR